MEEKVSNVDAGVAPSAEGVGREGERSARPPPRLEGFRARIRRQGGGRRLEGGREGRGGQRERDWVGVASGVAGVGRAGGREEGREGGREGEHTS